MKKGRKKIPEPLQSGLRAMVGPSTNVAGSTRFISSRFSGFIVFLSLSFLSLSVEARPYIRARGPPRGWNSYDSFCWVISEEEFLQSADIISKRLLPHGYEYAVVDYLWYRKNVKGASTISYGFDVFDEWGRVQPDPARWPSSKDGKGFTEVAKKVHSIGLKFGFHVMAGLSVQAFNKNTLIMDPDKGGPYEESGRQWRAQDIGIKGKTCAWMPQGFMSVNTSLGAGRAFLKSLYRQYYEWGVDFIKHDCVFGADFDLGEITIVSEVLRKLDRPILYSLSPGTSVTPALAKEVNQLVNMYRITGDDWDTWKDVLAHFDVSRDMAASQMIGHKGLLGKSWPDLDMLPLGWLTDPGSSRGPYRACRLTLDEQRTQMTLWAIAKSPLMFGGDVRNLDNATYNLITNPTLLKINAHSYKNKEFPDFTVVTGSMSEKRNLPQHPTDGGSSIKHAFGLTSCKDPRASAWSLKGFDENHGQVCWNQNLGSRLVKPFCLYNRKSLITSDENMTQNQLYRGKLHTIASNEPQSCLGASPKQKVTSKDHRGGASSTCEEDANQIWELRRDGTLENSYSGLCAVVNQIKAADAGSSGVRSWIAIGRKGQVYLAFFNLNEVKTTISAKISDMAKALPGYKLEGASCKSHELWSGQDFAPTKDSVSIEVAPHAPALFTLYCSP